MVSVAVFPFSATISSRFAHRQEKALNPLDGHDQDLDHDQTARPPTLSFVRDSSRILLQTLDITFL